jgi:tRNA (guanine-N7-)-methyltransferase
LRIRQHVNPLKSDFFGIPLAALELPAGAPVEVELGSAEAWFLMDRAQETPGGHYIGVEIRRELAWEANAESNRRGLANVHCVFANMTVDLPRLFAPRSVTRFHLNFPDPWFKSKQHKRRVMSGALVHELERLLVPGGEVHVASDIFEIALDSMAELEGHHRFENVGGPWSFLRESPFTSRSRREIQCRDEGTRIWRLCYRHR